MDAAKYKSALDDEKEELESASKENELAKSDVFKLKKALVEACAKKISFPGIHLKVYEGATDEAAKAKTDAAKYKSALDDAKEELETTSKENQRAKSDVFKLKKPVEEAYTKEYGSKVFMEFTSKALKESPGRDNESEGGFSGRVHWTTQSSLSPSLRLRI